MRRTLPRLPRPQPPGSPYGQPGHRSVGVDEEAADRLAGGLIAIALADLVQRVAPGDQPVQLQATLLVQPQQHRDLAERVARAEQRALHPLLEHGRELAAEGDGALLRPVGQRGQHQGAALPQAARGTGHRLGRHLPDRHDHHVGTRATREGTRQPGGLAGVGDGVGGAQRRGELPLHGHRVDADDVHRPGVHRTLDRVDPHPAEAEDDDGVTRSHATGVDRRTPAGRHAAGDECGGVSGTWGSIRTQENSLSSVCRAKAPTMQKPPSGSPSRRYGKVPLGSLPLAIVAPLSQRVDRPAAQNRQCPQAGRKLVTTWSPGATAVTPAPTAWTTPEPSCPPTIGYRPPGLECRRCSSEWHRPAYAISTSTSPGPGSRTSSSTISYSVSGLRRTAALVRTALFPSSCPSPCPSPWPSPPGHRAGRPSCLGVPIALHTPPSATRSGVRHHRRVPAATPVDQPPPGAAGAAVTEMCPGCGAVLAPLPGRGPTHPGASPGCARLFEVTLLGLREDALAEPAAAATLRLAEAAYDAQHAVPGDPDRLRTALGRLAAAAGCHVPAEDRDPPGAWRTTIADVAADLDVIDLPVLVESWAGSVAEDWSTASAAPQ